jgi:hypothetical protein
VIPADLWHSTSPYIDAQVRKERFEKIVLALHDAGFPVGEWAARVIEDVKYARDRNRAGGARSSAVPRSNRAASDSKNLPKDTRSSHKDETGVVGGEKPRLVRELGTHNIVFYKGLYYALPLALGGIDLTKDDVSGRPGVVVDSDEQAVLAELALVAKWADSRGHFDAQEKQRAEGSYFKAGSALGEAERTAIASRPVIVRFENNDFAIERQQLEMAFSAESSIGAQQNEAEDRVAGPTNPRTVWHKAFNFLPAAVRAEIRKAIFVDRLSRAQGTDGKVPSGRDLAAVALRSLYRRVRTHDLLRTIKNYNLVQFDGRFFGVPHGIYLDWSDFDPQTTPGMVVATTAKEATRLIENEIGHLPKASAAGASLDIGTGPASEFFPEPLLLDTIGEYNVVGYEGWIYGIPLALGALDLTEVDITEMPGVIKDVARDVVVNEINYLSEQRNAVAAE